MEKELYTMSELQADELLEKVRELKSCKSRFETIAAGKIEIIQEDLQRKNEKIDNQIQFMKDQLRAFFLTVEPKKTKTQLSYSLFSGKLVMKNATTKITHDDGKLAEWAYTNAREYMSIKYTNVFSWAEFKKDLVVENGMLRNSATGEVFKDIEGLSIEEVSETFDIK